MANKVLCRIVCTLTAILSGTSVGLCTPISADTLSAKPLFSTHGGITAIVSGANEFSPYYINANRDGVFTQSNAMLIDASILRPLTTERRFTYGFGGKVYAGWTSSVEYERCDENGEMITNPQHPARIWLQELWAGAKYRGVYLKFGLFPNGERSLMNRELGSGDIVMSDNARGLPRLSAGFIDFQNIPLTSGWVQVRGEISYGKFVDTDWLENHYNRVNSFITTGAWMHFASCHFRTNPSQPFSLTIGMQHAAQFGGKTIRYKNGVMTSVNENQVKPRDFVNALFPWKGNGTGSTGGDAAYYSGNHLGSWDVIMRYTLRRGSQIKAYLQSPWEDGSGIGKLNGFDGVWGIEYDFSPNDFHGKFALKEVVAEYIDFTNQSGPMHWAPGDSPGTAITGNATGADDYYNNFMYNGWANFGMGLGSPFVKSPVFNTDGYMRFTDNRVRGFHLGLTGSIANILDCRVMLSHRTSWGTPFLPALEKRQCTSMMVEVDYPFPTTPGLSLSAALAFDTGNLYDRNLGAFVAVRYNLTPNQRKQ